MTTAVDISVSDGQSPLPDQLTFVVTDHVPTHAPVKGSLGSGSVLFLSSPQPWKTSAATMKHASIERRLVIMSSLFLRKERRFGGSAPA
jgi:hypothetical protein